MTEQDLLHPTKHLMKSILTGVEHIAAERQRQIEKEGWTAEHDRQHVGGELAMVAALYAAPKRLYEQNFNNREDYIAFQDPWPRSWACRYDKREKHSRLRRLEIAGALIAAEIDRISVEEYNEAL